MATDLDRRAAPMRAWISFGAMVLLVSGTFNIIGGLVAVSVAQVYAGNVVVISRDLTAWGWTWLIYGLLEMAVGAGILTGRTWARVLGWCWSGLRSCAQ